jgi:polyisoprenoid-binding protein YceI
MARFDARSAECIVFVFKEGLLSKVGHDLELRAEDLLVEVEAGSVRARIGAAGLRVVSALREGAEVPSLSPSDKRDIEQTLCDRILDARRHPDIRFRSTRVEERGDIVHIEGALALHGVERALSLTARADAAVWVTEVALSQPDFGIKPYSAMFGALKVQPVVRVRWRVPRI